MKWMALLLLSLAVTLPAGATAQAPDVIKLNGESYLLYSNPLESVLAAEPDRLPKAEVISTGLWRGYIATWAVRDGKFFLEDVRVPTKEHMRSQAPEEERFRSVMGELFGDPAPRVASWFTGNLIVPTGEMLEYVHMGYGSTYSSYMVVKVVGGEVRQLLKMNRKQFETFRRVQFTAFKKTMGYATAFAEAKSSDESMSDKMVEEFLFQYLSSAYMARVTDYP
jgi:hypothetical protein